MNYNGKEYDLGRNPFPITWAGSSPGNERLYSVQDKRPPILNGVKDFYNPQGAKRAGVFYLSRWLFTGNQPLTLNPTDSIQNGDIYYTISLAPGQYKPTEIRMGHREIAKLLNRDRNVSWISGITWLGNIARRWGWDIAHYKPSPSTTYLMDIDLGIILHLKDLKRRGVKPEVRRKFLKRCNESSEQLVYMSRQKCLELYFPQANTPD